MRNLLRRLGEFVAYHIYRVANQIDYTLIGMTPFRRNPALDWSQERIDATIRTMERMRLVED